MKKTAFRRPTRTAAMKTAAVFAAGGLVLGAAACGDDDDSGDSGSSTSASSTAGSGASGSAGASASGAAGASEGAAASGAAGAEGDVTSADQLPDEVKAAYEQAGGESGELGAFTSFETSGDNSLATFANGVIATSPETGAQPIIGKIAETWVAQGSLENPVGLPTAPEQGDATSGWDQEFQNGTVGWHLDESGTWAATGAGAEGAAGAAGSGGAAE
ncbi:LGFP repeat-containing protein [Corynebacterium nuruki]|uniref:LGFP repeat-containing protein n=1 Tax=Corynebacterium nuruki TaxID=1032851 RepID=UPI0039BF2939